MQLSVASKIVLCGAVGSSVGFIVMTERYGDEAP
jgi:hypothetical protein